MSERSEVFRSRVDESRLDDVLRELRPGLKGYVTALLGGHRQHAEDVLQEVAMYVWNNRTKLPEIERFDRWILRVAYFKAQSKRRDLARDRHVMFGDAFFDLIADEAEAAVPGGGARRDALRECLARVTADDRLMLSRRYADNLPFPDIARLLGLNLAAVHQRFTRLRRNLRTCLDRRLAAGVAEAAPNSPVL